MKIKRYCFDNNISKNILSSTENSSNNIACLNLYLPIEDFDKYIKSKLSKEDLESFSDCTFVPLSLELNKNDMSIETFVVPVKSKSYE